MNTMTKSKQSVSEWKNKLIKQDEIDSYLLDGKDFIDTNAIRSMLEKGKLSDASHIRNIIKKSYAISLMSAEDLASLVQVQDPALREAVFLAAEEIKTKVYDNRVVTFAPLYCGSKCVNSCKYCGFRSDNNSISRRVLTMEEIVSEAQVLASKIGHKRLVLVYGEHPETSADYIAESLRNIYGIKEKVRNGVGEIRRVNINAAPLPIAELKKLYDAGIGTYQVFQESYDKEIYREVHPENTLKGRYQWRLYALHRAMDAGIDDVAIGHSLGLLIGVLNSWACELMQKI